MVIAHIGNFDQENIADLLYPIILKGELTKRIPGLEVDLYSPNGGVVPFTTERIYALENLKDNTKERGYAAFVISGTNLIRFDDESKEAAANSPLATYTWTEPFRIGMQLKVPVILNATEVPDTFPEILGEVAKTYLQHAAYISVPDEKSAERLSKLGLKNTVHVVPDTAFVATSHYAPEILYDDYRKIMDTYHLPERYIAFHYDGSAGDVIPPSFADFLRKLEGSLGCRTVLVPIDYSGRDEMVLRSFAEIGRFFMMPVKLSPRELIAFIGHAACFIGTSYHGLMLSLMSDISVFPLKLNDANRIVELAEMAGISKALGMDMVNTTPRNMAMMDSAKKQEIIDAVGGHFDEIVKVLNNPPQVKNEMTDDEIMRMEITYCNALRDNSHMHYVTEGYKKYAEQLKKQYEKQEEDGLNNVSAGSAAAKNDGGGIGGFFKRNKKDDKAQPTQGQNNQPKPPLDDIIEYITPDLPQAHKSLTKYDWDELLKRKPKIAIQAHIFYAVLIEEVGQCLAKIPYPFDLYLTTDEQRKDDYIRKYMATYLPGVKYQLDIVPNKGRDVYPFFKQMSERYGDYEYICHIHTKKNPDQECSNEWRKYLYKNLFFKDTAVQEILYQFEIDQKLGIVYPKPYAKVKPDKDWGGNKAMAKWMLKKAGLSDALPEKPTYPAGNMFWARSNALKDMFRLGFTLDDFPDENGETECTLMELIERMWVTMARAKGFKVKQTAYWMPGDPEEGLAVMGQQGQQGQPGAQQ